MKPGDEIKICLPVNDDTNIMGKALLLAITDEQHWARINVTSVEDKRYKHLIGRVYHLDYQSTEKLNRKLFLIVNNG